MKWQPWIASIAVALGVASCGENGPPPEQSHTALKPALLKTNPPAPVTDAKAAAQPGLADVAPAPAGTQWTILCDILQGPGHVENARDLKTMLARRSGMPDWYIIHTDHDSTIYYGYYRSLDAPAEKRRAEEDLRRIKGLADTLGNPIVPGDVLVAYNAPDPQAPPEWNLLNTPKTAYWSIEIATFSGNPLRKQAAVDMVRQLRQHGEKLAFYYHGPTASSVCIGAWPRDAVREQTSADAHALRADQPIVVFNDVLPPNVSADVREPGTGKRMVVEGKKLEYNDPQMQEKAKEYPVHSVNYEVRGFDRDGKKFPDPSVLVIVPHDEGSGGEDDSMLTGGPQRQPAVQSPPRPQDTPPGDSALRSIEGH